MVFFHSPPLYMVDTPVVCLLYYSLILTGSFFFFFTVREIGIHLLMLPFQVISAILSCRYLYFIRLISVN